MPVYVADTVALARYLEDSLPKKADTVFREAEAGNARILVPSVVLGELFYICLKGRLKLRDPSAIIAEVLDDIQSSTYLHQAEMSLEAWQHFLSLRIPELHDRMICCIALANSIDSIITNDPEIASSGIKTIW